METSSLKNIVCNGGLFLAKDTKRFLLLYRSQGRTANTWGLVGGKKELTDTTTLDNLNREVTEEVGKTPVIRKIIPLELFVSNDQKFQYNTYIMLVDKEFIPILNGEHYGYAWCKYDKWPKPLHQGLKTSFNNRQIKAKLEVILELL